MHAIRAVPIHGRPKLEVITFISRKTRSKVNAPVHAPNLTTSKQERLKGLVHIVRMGIRYRDLDCPDAVGSCTL